VIIWSAGEIICSLRDTTQKELRADIPYLFPSLCAVGFASAVDGSLVLAEVNQRNSKTSKVGYIVIEQLSGVVHFVVKATISHLHITSIILYMLQNTVFSIKFPLLGGTVITDIC